MEGFPLSSIGCLPHNNKILQITLKTFSRNSDKPVWSDFICTRANLNSSYVKTCEDDSLFFYFLNIFISYDVFFSY